MAGTDFESIGEAGEYVLGTLDAAERTAFEARLTHDSVLQLEVAEWWRRLVPLEDETVNAEPPPYLFDKILARLDAPVADNVVALRRRMNIWRGATVALAAIAAALLIFLLIPGQMAPQPKGLYVAVLQGDDAKPAFVAAIDVKSGVIAVRRVGPATPAGHSYELWALGAGRAVPQPLGVVEAAMRIPVDQLGGKPLGATMFAISLEPVGGSPTGAPTGPVLFTGKLLAAN
jgi:anti-sigma-K factor RskA